MPATYRSRSARQPRPATVPQLNFIRSLVVERDTAALMPIVREIEDAEQGRPIAADLIDRIIAIPRSGARTSSAAPTADGESVATPTADNRAGRMLLAGGIEATVTMPNGEHVTVKIRTRARTQRGWRNASPGEQGVGSIARTNIEILGRKVGWVNVTESGWVVSFRTRNVAFKDAVRVLFQHAANRRDELGGMGGYRVQEATRCGRCMLPLTDPVSIDRGIGPDCLGRDTGSQHVAAERSAAGDAVVAEPRVSTIEATDAARVQREESHWDAEFAAREREQETAAFLSDPDYRAHEERAVTETALEMVADALTTPAPEPVSLSARIASLSDLAAELESRQATPAVPTDRVERARHIIAEALDAYFDDADDKTFALAVFDDLAGR